MTRECFGRARRVHRIGVAAVVAIAVVAVAQPAHAARITTGDFQLTPTVNRYAFEREPDFTPFRSEMTRMSAARFAQIERAVSRRSFADQRRAERSLGITATEATVYYLKRIESANPYYRAVMELNPQALAQARAIDRSRDPGLTLRGLVGLVKGNTAVAGMRNDAGSGALADTVASADATVVARLRSKGAVILGRANLTELANFIIPEPGFSAQGGQTLSPFGPLTLSPSSSSSGSAAALPLGLASFTLGTETFGSIIAPAAVEGVAALRPDTGSWATDGVVPFDSAYDVVGPLGYSVEDLIALHTAVTGGVVGAPSTRVVVTDTSDSAFATETRRLLTAAGITAAVPDQRFLDAWSRANYGSNPARTCGFVQSMDAWLPGSGHAVHSVAQLAAWYREHPRQAPYGTAQLDRAAADTTTSEECRATHETAAANLAALDVELRRLGATFVAGQNNGGSGSNVGGAARGVIPIAVSADRTTFSGLSLNSAARGHVPELLATMRAIERARTFDPNAVPLVAPPAGP